MPVAIPLLAGATLASGVLGYMGSKSASQKQYDAAMAGLQLQREQQAQNQKNYTESVDRFNPWLQTGQGANHTLAGMYGFGGSGNENHTADYSSFYNSPDYAFAQQQGLRAVDMSAASKGLLQSGGQGRALQNFGQGMASQQFGNFFNRMMTLSNQGLGAAQSIMSGSNQFANINANMANSQSSLLQGAGQAQASGIVGGTNAITGSLGSGINNLMLYSQLNKSPSGYGGNPLNIAQPQVGNYGTNLGNSGGTSTFGGSGIT